MEWTIYFAFFLAALSLLAELVIGAAGWLALIALISALSGTALLRVETPALQAWSNATLALLGLGFVALMGIVIWLSRRLHGKRSVAGAEGLLYAQGVVISVDPQTGNYADIQGERWKIRAKHPLQIGQTIQVTAVHGLVLDVQAI